MASVYMVKSTGKWQAQIRRAGEEPIVGTYPTRAEAQAFADAAEARIKAERAAKFDPRSTLPKSGDLHDEKLFKTISLFVRSPACTMRHNKILPTVQRHIGEVTIGGLTPGWAEDYIDKMRKERTRRGDIFAFATIRAHLLMINVVVKWRARRVQAPTPASVADRSFFPDDWERRRTRRLAPHEERALMARFKLMTQPSRFHWRLLVRLAIETAARLQELIKADWNEFTRGAVERIAYWTIPLAHTKCKAERVVPLTDRAIRIVRILKMLADPASPRVFHMLGSPASVSALFHRYADEAGLVDFRLHDLRHEGCSRLVLTQRQYRIDEIMAMVGHSTPSMLKRYTHLRGDELAAKMTRVRWIPPSDQDQWGRMSGAQAWD